jgi:hypothetical protein
VISSTERAGLGRYPAELSGLDPLASHVTGARYWILGRRTREFL